VTLETASSADSLTCPKCGHTNAAWRYLCEQCNATLTSPLREEAVASESAVLAALNRDRPRGRPGCVTLYVVLMWIGCVLGALGAVVLLVAMPEVMRRIDLPAQFPRGLITVIIGLALVVVAFEFILGLGLWHMKNWARIVLLIFGGLGLLGNLVQLVTGLAGRGQASQAIGALVSMAVGGLIFYWFAANGKRFS
jgi:CDP-diglyceride synthetase